jgi:ABC-type multidrug transport system ATPase subunit
VAIAGLIAMQPSCMIFDESTAMLDPVGRREVVECFEKLNRERGITVITITHYMNEAARADRVIVLDEGRVLMDGTPAEVFAKAEELVATGLDVPQCTSLVHALRKNGIEIDGEPVTTEECAEMILRAWEGKHGNGNA